MCYTILIWISLVDGATKKMILALTEPQNINMRNEEVPREDEVRLSVKSLYVNGDCWKQLDSRR